MGAFFDKLLEERKLNVAPIPLWKLDIRSDEYEELKTVVRDAVLNRRFASHGSEFALFYAESWRREYCGGHISKETVASYANIPAGMAEPLFQYAKGTLCRLHIPVIHQNNNQYFRTLLLQGGLPMAYIRQKNQGFNKFKDFLKRMVAELSQLAVDWDDVEVVKSLGCVRYLPETCKNDNIYAVSLQIARAIIEERDDLLPYDTNTCELQELTRVLKTERDRVKRLTITHPLVINWTLRVQEGEDGCIGVFRYSLGSVKTIRSGMINGLKPESCFQFDLFVSQHYVATYKKVKIEEEGQENESTIYKRVNSDNQEFKWNGESVIEVKLLCDNDDELFPSVINNCAPNLAIPQMFQKRGDVYVQQKDYASPECIVLHSCIWQHELRESTKDVSILGEPYQLTKCPEMDESQSVVFVNSETGETVELQNRTSKFSAVFEGVFLPWLEKSNHALLAKKLRVSVYDDQGVRIAAGYRILYREKGTTEWRDYSNRCVIRPGIVDVKVEFPDKSADEKRFYFIGDLGFEISGATATSANVKCNLNWGTISPTKQENVRYEMTGSAGGSVTWKVERTPDTLKFPSTCSFEIRNPGNPVLKVSIPSPYDGLCLVKNEDELVRNGSVLSFNEFASYRILCAGEKSQSIKIGYKGARIGDCAISIQQNVKRGITPLSNFEDSINRIFNVYGSNPFDRSSAAELTIGDKIYRMRYFTRSTKLNVPMNALEVHSSDASGPDLRSALENALVDYDGNLLACRISGPEDDFTSEVQQLEHQDCGYFVSPQGMEDGDYVVFSDAYDAHRVIPRMYGIANGQWNDEPSKERQNHRQNNVEEWVSVLSAHSVSDANSWGKVPLYMEIAEKWRLPFRTFNAITAAVSSPELTTKLLLRLLLDDKLDALSSAILKIEQECAMAIHWNRPEIVSEQINHVIENYPNLWLILSQGFIDALNNSMTLTLDADVAGLMTRFLCGNLRNEEADRLTNTEVNDFRSRAIGKNTGGDINSDMPVQELHLEHDYYAATIKMLPYQETLIRAPLYVYEYTQGWSDGLWDSSPEGLRRRKIINFYRLHYKYTYYTILAKMLK